MARIAKERAVAAEQCEVNAPGIDAHAGKLAVLGVGFAQACDHFAVEAEHVPVQGVERLHSAIGETVDNVETEFLAVKLADESAPAFRAEIEGEDLLGCRHGLHPSNV